MTYAREPGVPNPYEENLPRKLDDRIIVSSLRSPLSHASAQELTRRDPSRDERCCVVIYDLSHASYLDRSTAQSICEIIEQTQNHGRHVILSGVRGHTLMALDQAGVFDRLPHAQCFSARKAAFEAAAAFCHAD